MAAKKRTRTVRAWHFLSPTKRLGYGDGRLVKLGKWLEVEGEPVCCVRGLHASLLARDAIQNIGGTAFIACRVELGGKMDTRRVDKIAAQKRKVLWWVNVKSACEDACESIGLSRESAGLLDLADNYDNEEIEKILHSLRRKQLKKARARKAARK